MNKLRFKLVWKILALMFAFTSGYYIIFDDDFIKATYFLGIVILLSLAGDKK